MYIGLFNHIIILFLCKDKKRFAKSYNQVLYCPLYEILNMMGCSPLANILDKYRIADIVGKLRFILILVYYVVYIFPIKIKLLVYICKYTKIP